MTTSNLRNSDWTTIAKACFCFLSCTPAVLSDQLERFRSVLWIYEFLSCQLDQTSPCKGRYRSREYGENLQFFQKFLLLSHRVPVCSYCTLLAEATHQGSSRGEISAGDGDKWFQTL